MKDKLIKELVSTERHEMVLKSIPIRVTGKIKQARDAYQKLKVPKQHLLEDYLAVKEYKLLDRDAANPWLYYHKGILGRDIESGMSADERLFNESAISLNKSLPTDVIKQLFYKDRNDSALECGYLLRKLISDVTDDEKIMIVNPSPDMILTTETKRSKSENNIYIVNDDTVARLYQIQFPDAKFYSEKVLDTSIPDCNHCLIIGRDRRPNQIPELLHWGAKCNGSILSCLPNAFFDNKENSHYVLQDEKLYIESVVPVPTNFTQTSPKKKCIVELGRGEHVGSDFNYTLAESDKDILKISDRTYVINGGEFWQSNVTLIGLVSICNNYGQESDAENTSKTDYSKSKLYRLSREIQLNYAVYSDKDRMTSNVWYCETIDSETGKKGRKVSPIVRKGMAIKDESEIPEKMEKVIFDNRLLKPVIQDINRLYVANNKPVTLKTCWVCCRDQLNIDEKDDEWLEDLFVNGSKDISDFIPLADNGNELIEALNRYLNTDDEGLTQRQIGTVNTLIETSCDLGYAFYNPVSSILIELRKRATKRQQQVREVLTKKHFTDQEEEKIFEFLIKKDGDSIKCVEKGIWLIGAIRFFTGMALKEACALKWDDFQQIEGTDTYHIRISKFLNNDAKLESHIHNDNWVRFRWVPCAKPLSIVLLKRKQLLLNRGITEESLKRTPIVTNSEDKNVQHNAYCKPSKAADYCRRVIKAAQIPEKLLLLPDSEKDLATDIYKYNGDIFLSNLRMHLNHECGFTAGELNYMIGIKAPDTFSAYYCDYSNNMIQYGMVKKMSRWTSKLEARLENEKSASSSIKLLDKDSEVTSGPILIKLLR